MLSKSSVPFWSFILEELASFLNPLPACLSFQCFREESTHQRNENLNENRCFILKLLHSMKCKLKPCGPDGIFSLRITQQSCEGAFCLVSPSKDSVESHLSQPFLEVSHPLRRLV